MKTEKIRLWKTNTLNLNPTKSGPRLGLQSCSLLAALALVLGFTPLAYGTITVTSLNDSGPGSLRQAIADAAPGDTIDFAVTGTITLTSGELVVAKNLTISGPGATNLTVSGNNASRVLSFNNVSAVVTALTIANGRISTGNGAGINNLGGSLVLSNCVVTGNSADDWCLGIGIANSGSLTIFNSTISNNHGNRGDGGAIYNGPGGGASLRLINSTICQNYGSETGGLYNNYGHCAITNSTISGNSAYWHSGVHTRGPGTFWLCHSTVTGNAAMATWGRAVFVTAGGSLNIFNSIVAGNEVGTSSIDIVVEPIGSILISHDFNLIGKIWGGARTGVTTHNIYGKDPLLGPLADNGGPTLTHALLPGSPAIDHGSSGGLTTDQRGLPRPFNFPAYYDADDGSDIGAYELQERAQSGPVFTVNSNDDVDDGVPGIAHCSLREAINAANAIPGTNTINFATAIPGLMNGVTGTIVLTNGQLSVAKNDALSIIGPGATNLTISGNYSNRILLARLPLLSVTGLTFADGYAPGPPNYTTSSGGAISSFNGAGAIDISRCMFRGNVAAAYGGAVFQYSGFLKIAESVFQNNVADGGGAIVCLSASVNGTCMFSNTANSGGALTVFAGEKAGLTNCTMTANTVFGSGGGIGCWQAGDFGGMVYVDSCTISSNNAATGGGISMQNFPIHIRNSIIAGNRASSDSSGPDIRAIITSDDFNLIQNTNACTITNLTAHNIYNQDPKLGPLADLGGPTPTHALRYDSPAIDAGNSGGLTTDQRGLPRPIGAPSVAGGDGSDIGAYEADPNLRIMAIERLGQDIRLRFNNLFGRTYEVERTDTLVPPVIWTPVLGAEVVAGDGGIVTIIDPAGAGAPQRFYRVQLEAAPGAGDSRSALSFDGGDRVIIANNPALNPSTITVETWVNFGRLAYGDGWSPTDHQILIVKGGDTSVGEYRLIQSGSSSTEHSISFYIGQTYSGTGLGVTWPLETNRWYHIAATYDGSSMQLFIDGQVAASNYVGTAVIGNNSPLYFGFNDAWPFYLTGRMDDVRIWNYARTAAQIHAAMYSTLTGNEPGLAGYWNFNEPADSQTVLDRTPNGCHGQLGSSMGVDADDPTRVLRGPVR